MTETKALYIHGSSGTPSYNALDDRIFVAALLGAGPFDTVTAGIGARGRGHGVLASDALTVTSTGANNKGVNVAAGYGLVRGMYSGQHGCYLCPNDGSVTLTLADRSATQSRTDLIVARVRDAAFNGADNDWQLAIVQGTNGGPVPTPGNSELVLAEILIPSGANPFQVGSGGVTLTDRRPHARATGGITPVASEAAVSSVGFEDYDFVWDVSTSTLKMRLDGAWKRVGTDLDAQWTTFTPSWTGLTLGTGGVQYGRYVRLGRTITGICGYQRGTSGSSQSGTIRLNMASSGLPAINNEAGILYLAGGRAFDLSASVFWSCAAHVDPTAGEINNFGTIGQTAWAATVPFTWGNQDMLRIFFNYQSAT